MNDTSLEHDAVWAHQDELLRDAQHAHLVEAAMEASHRETLLQRLWHWLQARLGRAR